MSLNSTEQPKSERLGLTLGSYAAFFRAALLRQRQVGAIFPSQRFLISKMISPVPEDYDGEIVELGAGSGALTLRLAERCPDAAILACEINSSLAKATQRNLAFHGFGDRVRVVSKSAETLLRSLPQRPDFIISGIPLGNIGRRETISLIRQIHQRLAPGGLYIQFQYSLLDRKHIRSQFRFLRTLPAFLNFPPAFVYFATK